MKYTTQSCGFRFVSCFIHTRRTRERHFACRFRCCSFFFFFYFLAVALVRIFSIYFVHNEQCFQFDEHHLKYQIGKCVWAGGDAAAAAAAVEWRALSTCTMLKFFASFARSLIPFECYMSVRFVVLFSASFYMFITYISFSLGDTFAKYARRVNTHKVR